jgi:hypothetical protein
MLLGRFSSIKMLEWRETEHEEEEYFFGNDPSTVTTLWECVLLKLFKVQGMRPQLRLLEYIFHMWDVNEQAFHVGMHTLVRNQKCCIFIHLSLHYSLHFIVPLTFHHTIFINTFGFHIVIFHFIHFSIISEFVIKYYKLTCFD